jgi:hypothetical protein
MMTNSPAVSCTACARTWHSPAMVDGLRMLGTCPRCGGELEFLDQAAADPAARQSAEGEQPLAPHLVLGIPRR